jgi:HSP20 family protein
MGIALSGRREPFEELRRLREEMNRMFEDLFRMPREAYERAMSYILEEPLADVYETESEIVVEADLPGVEKENISVNATEDSLEISAEIRKAEEAKKATYIRRERKYERFHRRISLPARVKPEEAKSTYRNGVLQVRLPKVEVKKGIRVKIE